SRCRSAVIMPGGRIVQGVRIPVSHTRLARLTCLASIVLGVAICAAQNAPGPQVNPYLPTPTGLADADVAALNGDAEKLAAQITELKKEYPTGAMHDRVADVEVFWSGVHNQ